MGRCLRDIDAPERLSPAQLDRVGRIISEIEELRAETVADPAYPVKAARCAVAPRTCSAR